MGVWEEEVGGRGGGAGEEGEEEARRTVGRAQAAPAC